MKKIWIRFDHLTFQSEIKATMDLAHATTQSLSQVIGNYLLPKIIVTSTKAVVGGGECSSGCLLCD